MSLIRLDTKEEILNYDFNENSLFVVIDTCMFSSVAIALFDRGVSLVNVFEEPVDTEYPFGGEKGGHNTDFSNYPQSVYGSQSLTNQDKVGITSDNGAVSCHMVERAISDPNIVLASSININSVSNYILESDHEDTVIVQSGSHGNFQLEDSITSGLICQKVRGQRHNGVELLQSHLWDFVSDYYPWFPEEDLDRLSDFSSYNIIPIRVGSSEEYITFKEA